MWLEDYLVNGLSYIILWLIYEQGGPWRQRVTWRPDDVTSHVALNNNEKIWKLKIKLKWSSRCIRRGNNGSQRRNPTPLCAMVEVDVNDIVTWCRYRFPLAGDVANSRFSYRRLLSISNQSFFLFISSSHWFIHLI